MAIGPNHQQPLFADVLVFDEADRIGPGVVNVEVVDAVLSS